MSDVRIIDHGDTVTFITENDKTYTLTNKNVKHLDRPWAYTEHIEKAREEWYELVKRGYESLHDMLDNAAKDIAKANKSMGSYQNFKFPMVKKPFP